MPVTLTRAQKIVAKKSFDVATTIQNAIDDNVLVRYMEGDCRTSLEADDSQPWAEVFPFDAAFSECHEAQAVGADATGVVKARSAPARAAM